MEHDDDDASAGSISTLRQPPVARPAPQRSAARQAALRTNNLAVVVEHVVRAGAISRADIAQQAGLTRATVSSLVEQLLALQVLEWAPAAAGGGVGRPAAPVRLAHATRAGLGLEIGANHLCAAVVDLAGQTLAFREVRGDFAAPSARDSLSALGRLGALTWEQAAAAHPGLLPLGTTLAVPGIVRDAVALDAPRLGWTDVPAAALLDEVLPAHLVGDALVAGTPAPTLAPTSLTTSTRLGNEATLAALAESHARGSESFLYLSGGVGVGGAYVLEGRLQGGAHGFASELGHVTVDPDGPACRCGATGCLEQYAGAHALTRTSLADTGRALGIALSSAINVLDVASVVLGGTLGPLLPQLRETLEAELATRVLAYPWAPVTLDAARVTGFPGLHGAALTPVLQVLADPESVLSIEG